MQDAGCKDAGCKDAMMQGCKDAQDAGMHGIQGCKNAGCKDAGCRDARDARMQPSLHPTFRLGLARHSSQKLALHDSLTSFPPHAEAAS